VLREDARRQLGLIPGPLADRSTPIVIPGE
jgi:hypothetical protein